LIYGVEQDGVMDHLFPEKSKVYMNSPPPDDDAPHMPVVFRELRALAACLAILEMRIMAESATSSLPLSHLPKKAKKKSNSPPPNPYY
jgi:hypothetical protein